MADGKDDFFTSGPDCGKRKFGTERTSSSAKGNRHLRRQHVQRTARDFDRLSDKHPREFRQIICMSEVIVILKLLILKAPFIMMKNTAAAIDPQMHFQRFMEKHQLLDASCFHETRTVDTFAWPYDRSESCSNITKEGRLTSSAHIII